MKMAELKILSCNAQGIGGISKRTDIFLRNTHRDIYCLKETHFPILRKDHYWIYGMESARLTTIAQMQEELQYYFEKI